MFAATLRRVYRTCDKVVIRNIRGSRHVPGGPNPGLDKRIQAFKQDGFQISDEDAEEFVEDSASDFFKAGQVHKEHTKEKNLGKDMLKQHIVKEKYFKENLPNLLTWSEKEQIRHLAQEHPEEWTPERLAESFPVTVPVVKKLLKYVWKPATEERIARHDASVMRNWKALNTGTLHMSQSLREHFLKFSKRTVPPLNENSIQKTEFTKENRLGEFEEIIQRCAAKERESKNNSEYHKQSDTENDKIETQRVRKDPKFVTLDELKEKIKKRMEKGKSVDVPDKLMVTTLSCNEEADLVKLSTPSEIELTEGVKEEENMMTGFKKQEEKESTIMSYPERIRIPKKAYKRGATYKVNDCYYDHDGKFLYRVLGMSN